MIKTQSFFNLGSGRDPNKEGKVKSFAGKIGCPACKLNKNCVSPEIEVMGKGNKKILFITECPGKYEDKNNTVFSKKERNMLSEILDEIDINLNTDCWSMFAVRCATVNYETPTDREVNFCRDKLLQTIETLQPTVIITLGSISLKSLIHHRISGRLSGTEMSAFYGYTIPDQDLEKYICPTYSINYIHHQIIKEKGVEQIDPVYLRFFKRAIKNACGLSKNSVYIHNYESDILTTKDPKVATKWINKSIKKDNILTFDYETDGIKPHEEGHELVTASFSDGLFGYAFPFFYDDPDFMRAWYRFTQSKKVGKVAHKMDFENSWTKERGSGKWINNWEWDTCLAAHCIDSHKPTNQKFYVYVYLGILNYDNSVDKYLKANKKDVKRRGANAFNNIKKANLDDVLLYNGQDSLFCYKIFELQVTKLKGKFKKGFKFFLDGAEVLSKIQSEGMLVNVKKIDKHNKILTRKIDRTYNIMKSFPEWKKWKGKLFNPGSDPQLSTMLYDILKYPKPKKGGSATDKKQLTRIGTDFTLSILPYRSYLKMRDTYLAQFKREHVNRIIRTFFNLHIPQTFRSSSDSPNFTNMPARDPQALRWVMSVINPRPGNKLIEWDYKGVEVTVSCCYHKDPNMIVYVKDHNNDMHRDTAADILLKKKSEVTKTERQIAKNGYVFPSFYGSGVPAVAPNIWEELPEESKAHLHNQGIKKYKDFYGHMETVHKIFWNERFPVYRDWKRKIYKDYLKKGYVDLLTGFRYYGPAAFTQITNAPIQGAAFHILLWSLINIYPIIKKNFEQSIIIGQIHDAIVGDIYSNDEAEIDNIIKLYGTEKVREHWNWIILPLRLEKESTEINGTWDTMESRKFI